MTKKNYIATLGVVTVLGAILAATQIGWAAGGSAQEQQSSQASQTDHAAHHSGAEASEAAAASPVPVTANMQEMMKNGSMDNMMKENGMPNMMKNMFGGGMSGMMDMSDDQSLPESCAKLHDPLVGDQTSVQ